MNLDLEEKLALARMIEVFSISMEKVKDAHTKKLMAIDKAVMMRVLAHG